MKGIKVMCGVLVVAVVFVVSVANAGLLNKIKGNKSGGAGNAQTSSASYESYNTAWEALAKDYIEATFIMASSLESAGASVGAKEEVVKIMAVVKGLEQGSLTNPTMKTIQRATKEAQAIIQEKLKTAAEPNAASKKLMAKSITEMATSLGEKAVVGSKATQLAKDSKSAASSGGSDNVKSLLGIAKGAAVVGTAVPVDIKIGKEILSSYVAYANTNNIKVPKDATALLK